MPQVYDAAAIQASPERRHSRDTANLRRFRKGDRVVCDHDIHPSYFAYHPWFDGVAVVLTEPHESFRIKLPDGSISNHPMCALIRTFLPYIEEGDEETPAK